MSEYAYLREVSATVARSTKMGNARASTSGTSSEYRLSRIFYLRPESGESIGQKMQMMKAKFLLFIAPILLVGLSGCSGDEPGQKDDDYSSSGKHKDHEYVDLGLPSGVKWATCNVGADSPGEYGECYQWGGLTPYDPANNRENRGGTEGLPLGDIAGTEYDVAHVKWGGKWRMPTNAELHELIDECRLELAVKGYRYCFKVIGPNGKFIYLPMRLNTYEGQYWSSTPALENCEYSWCEELGDYESEDAKENKQTAHCLYIETWGDFKYIGYCDELEWRNTDYRIVVRPVYK